MSTDRNWDKELAAIDKQLESVSDAQLFPQKKGAAPQQQAQVAAQQETAKSWPAILRLSLSVVLGVGILFWPYANHTVAVWTVGPAGPSETRVIVPTSQVFLGPSDTFGTRRFNPWTQRAIYDYTRRDVPDSFEMPPPLASFFLSQADKYAGASDAALQELRYLRESVFLKQRSPDEAARAALERRTARRAAPAEDLAAFAAFAADLRR